MEEMNGNRMLWIVHINFARESSMGNTKREGILGDLFFHSQIKCHVIFTAEMELVTIAVEEAAKSNHFRSHDSSYLPLTLPDSFQYCQKVRATIGMTFPRPNWFTSKQAKILEVSDRRGQERFQRAWSDSSVGITKAELVVIYIQFSVIDALLGVM